MLAKLTRGTALLFLVAMIAAWVLSVGKQETAQPRSVPQIEYLYV